jgi:threonine aldolase
MVPNRIVPLISDTESKPTAGMRQAIATAEVGDEQRGEDPTVNRLQLKVAELLGKEAALWFPGGTMCNFVAVKVHTKPGDAIVAEAMAHIIRAESAGGAFSCGVLTEPSQPSAASSTHRNYAMRWVACKPHQPRTVRQCAWCESNRPTTSVGEPCGL